MSDLLGSSANGTGHGLGSGSAGDRRIVVTAPDAANPRLRGRTYAIPFDPVWRSALFVARGEMRGWTVVGADDELGIIKVEAVRRLGGQPLRIQVVIRLDDNGQTRVDLHAEAPRTAPGLPRVFERFFRRLQVATNATPGLLIDPTSEAPWQKLASS